MRPRNSLLEIFSTFLQFDVDRPHYWATDARLRRSMQQRLAHLSTAATSEHFWALYWHQLWQEKTIQTNRQEDKKTPSPDTPHPTPVQPILTAEAYTPSSSLLAQFHLSAYLQEPCYWAAQKTKLSFTTTQYTLPDCFQIAIAQVTKVLKGFNPKQGFNLESYASAIFSSVIRDTLRQQREIDICTNWGLLRKVSQKRLIEALQTAGQGTNTIQQYVLAWTCFKTLYVPTQATANRKLPKPDPETWQAIADLYNKERYTLSNAASETPETLEKWLTICAQAARSYLNPKLVSINTPKPGQDNGELLDDVPESPRESLLTEMIAQEEQIDRQSQQKQLNTVLTDALAEFDPPTRSLLQLYYGEELTQQQIASQLDMKQYTVSRRLSRARETLLTALACWSKESMHISLTADVLNYTSTVLEEWLQRHYHQTTPSPAMEQML